MAARPPSTHYDTAAGEGCIALGVGGPAGPPGRALHVNCTVAGSASITFADGTIMPDLQLAQAGAYIFNYAVTQVNSVAGGFVGTFYNIR